jgi:hypothetical protein
VAISIKTLTAPITRAPLATRDVTGLLALRLEQAKTPEQTAVAVTEAAGHIASAAEQRTARRIMVSTWIGAGISIISLAVQIYLKTRKK